MHNTHDAWDFGPLNIVLYKHISMAGHAHTETANALLQWHHLLTGILTGILAGKCFTVAVNTLYSIFSHMENLIL
jgi:hypothetical protein